MKPIRLVFFAFGLSSFISLANAGEMGAKPLDHSSLFFGVGGSYNQVQSKANTVGVLNVLEGAPPLGVYSGRNHDSKTKGVFAPDVEVGYFRHFTYSNWLWGFNFLYQYSNFKVKNSSEKPTAGAAIQLTNLSQDVNNLVSLNPIETRINTEFMLPLFLGYSLANSFIYAGAGPSVFHLQRKVGRIDDSSSALFIGTAPGFSNSDWIWGGAVRAGIAYYLNPSWFVSLNYSYSFTGNTRLNKKVFFTPAVNGGLNSGTVALNTTQRLNSQNLSLSINKVFTL